MSDRKNYKVKATPALFGRLGDAITLDFKDYVRIFKPGVEHVLVLSEETAAQLARDGYDVAEDKPAPAPKAEKAAEK